MSAEDMGKLANRTRLIFAVSSVVFLAVLAISPFKDFRREWKQYKRSYLRFAQSRPDTKKLLAEFRPDIDQIWLPGMNVVDRCTPGHRGITQASLSDSAVPQPFRAHPPIPHNVRDWGCTVCHRGQGPATEVAEAHESTLAWEQPILPTRFIQASCGTCHYADLPETPQLTRGRELLAELNCQGCHRLPGIERSAMLGPDLTNIGTKVSREWIYKWLKEPRTIVDKDGNVTVNGYETQEEPRMPRYGWSDEDLYKVTQYITTKLTDSDLLTGVPQLGQPTEQEIQLGHRLFLEKGCASCHSIQGLNPQKDFGPDLSALGGKNASDLEFGVAKIPHNLVAYIQAKLQDPTSVNAAARMPQYNWNQSDLDAITTALLSMKGPPATSALENLVVPSKKAVFHPMGAFGEVYERYKCYTCHKFNGYGGDLAPDLTYEGSRAQRGWLVEFLKNPQTLRPTLILRMPQFNMTDKEAATLADYMLMVWQHPAANPTRIDAIQVTPALLALGILLYQVIYQCQACHTIGGTGGYVGPNLNNAGGWLTAAWIEAWLRNPHALVPGTIEPRRNFTEAEVNALTAYLMTLRQSIKPQKTASAARSRAAAQGAGQ